MVLKHGKRNLHRSPREDRGAHRLRRRESGNSIHASLVVLILAAGSSNNTGVWSGLVLWREDGGFTAGQDIARAGLNIRTTDCNTMSSAEDPPFPLGVPTACFMHLDDGPNPSAAAATDAGG